MLKKRSLTVFAVAFVVVLIGGVALAQVGTFGASSDEPPDIVAADQFLVDEEAAPAGDEAEEKPSVSGNAEQGADDVAEPEEAKPPIDAIEEPKDEKAEVPEDEKIEEPEGEEVEKPDATAPEFAILFPEDGYHTDDEVQVFEGHVEPGATVTRGKYEAKVDGEGWRIELVLSPGKNVVTLVATDAAGNQAKDTVTVYLEGHDEEAPEDEPGAVEFTAFQKFGSCGEEIPYDVFYGTAAPGATIHVVSPYGAGTTTAGEKGKWDLKVTFPEAPAGQVFEVVVESSDGGRQVFTFVNTGGGGGEGDHDK